MKVYRVVRGTRSTGTRRGMYVVAIADQGYYHPSTLFFGRVVMAKDPVTGHTTHVFRQDGDRVWSFEDAPQGWGEYAYTHGGPVFRRRCGVAHALWVQEYPDRYEYDGLILEAVTDEAERELVLSAFDRCVIGW